VREKGHAQTPIMGERRGEHSGWPSSSAAARAIRASRERLRLMAYDVELANRVREVVGAEPGLTEKRMFGGLAFLIQGHMAVGASSKGGLLLRIDPAETESLVNKPHVDRFEMRGREMDGWLRVDAEAVEMDDDLRRWVSRGLAYARSLPPK
jgi:TfoX N-terminal domain